MGRPLQGLRGQWTIAIEEMNAKPRRAQGGGPCGGPAGAADEPAFGGKPAGERRCGIAQSETEEVRPVHNGWRPAKADGSNSSVSTMRFCLSRVHAKNAQEMSAPTASGRRSPKRPLSEPIRTAPSAGPARKIMR